MEFEPGRRHELRFKASLRPHEGDGVPAIAQGGGQCQARVDMPGRSSARHEDVQRHDQSPCVLARRRLGRESSAGAGARGPRTATTSARPIESSTPTAPNETTSDEPPKEMNGSGTPVMGSTPVAPPRLMSVWIANHPTIPAAR